jgi:hypothetical protein
MCDMEISAVQNCVKLINYGRNIDISVPTFKVHSVIKAALNTLLSLLDMFIWRLFLSGCISCRWLNGWANLIGTAGVLNNVSKDGCSHLVNKQS